MNEKYKVRALKEKNERKKILNNNKIEHSWLINSTKEM